MTVYMVEKLTTNIFNTKRMARRKQIVLYYSRVCV